MKEDLHRYFPQYRVSVQKRRISCLALVRVKNKDKDERKPLASKGGENSMKVSLFGAEIRNGTLASLIIHLNAGYLHHLPTPIIDETQYEGRVDLKLIANMSDVASIRNALQVYGLDLEEVKRRIKVLVIEDAK